MKTEACDSKISKSESYSFADDKSSYLCEGCSEPVYEDENNGITEEMIIDMDRINTENSISHEIERGIF